MANAPLNAAAFQPQDILGMRPTATKHQVPIGFEKHARVDLNKDRVLLTRLRLGKIQGILAFGGTLGIDGSQSARDLFSETEVINISSVRQRVEPRIRGAFNLKAKALGHTAPSTNNVGVNAALNNANAIS